MKNSTNKIKILKTLLESPKTTGQIAIALDYKDDKGHGIYKNIISDLKTLGQYGFIHEFKSNKKNVGAPARTYDIVYDISILREILKKYPFLISDLQKSDKILSMLVSDIIYSTTSDNKPFMPSEFLRDMLRRSPSFFKNFLVNDCFLLNYWKICLKIHTTGYITAPSREALPAAMVRAQQLEVITMAFEHCFIEDCLEGISTWQAENLLNDLKKGYTIKENKIIRFGVV